MYINESAWSILGRKVQRPRPLWPLRLLHYYTISLMPCFIPSFRPYTLVGLLITTEGTIDGLRTKFWLQIQKFGRISVCTSVEWGATKDHSITHDVPLIRSSPSSGGHAWESWSVKSPPWAPIAWLQRGHEHHNSILPEGLSMCAYPTSLAPEEWTLGEQCPRTWHVLTVHKCILLGKESGLKGFQVCTSSWTNIHIL